MDKRNLRGPRPAIVCCFVERLLSCHNVIMYESCELKSWGTGWPYDMCVSLCPALSRGHVLL